jgi:hypothetical protein
MLHFARLEDVRERDFLLLGTAILYLRYILIIQYIKLIEAVQGTIRVYARAKKRSSCAPRAVLSSFLLRFQQGSQDLQAGIYVFPAAAAFSLVEIGTAYLA